MHWLIQPRTRVPTVSSAVSSAAGRTCCLAVSLAGLIAFLCCSASAGTHHAESGWLSPNALCASADGAKVFVSCSTGRAVLEVDTVNEKILRSISVPASPSGLALSANGRTLWVTLASVDGTVAEVDVPEGKTKAKIRTGHTPMSPVLAPGEATLYVCNRFNDEVAFVDVRSRKVTHRVKVQREPVSVDVTPDGKHLLVANLLHNARADALPVRAVITVIDTQIAKVVKEVPLPSGSGSLNAIKVSPDGRFAVVTHILSRFHLPTTQLDRGWMNTNAKTIVDLKTMEVVNTVLLDNVDRGAANPWAVAWSADSKTLAITHAGTHEVSLLDFPALLTKLEKLPRELPTGQPIDYASASRVRSDVPNDLAFLVGLRRRVALPKGEWGPRSAVMIGTRLCVANYFSDSISSLDTREHQPQWQRISLNTGPGQQNINQMPSKLTPERQGEMLFHDAGICFQGWQSCASCHPGEGRVDALNWDLLNDGIGNPKNNKSLLLVHSTPPAMSRGVRESAEEAVRAGIKHILFTVQPPEVGEALDAYLKSLKPVPSPRLVKGELSKSAKRGRKVYNDASVGCASCHPSGLWTDLKAYDVGTAGQFDQPGDAFDTPTLVEVWRTAPYLHDGSAATVLEVFTERNKEDKHGRTSHLTKEQLQDLAEYLLSL